MKIKNNEVFLALPHTWSVGGRAFSQYLQCHEAKSVEPVVEADVNHPRVCSQLLCGRVSVLSSTEDMQVPSMDPHHDGQLGISPQRGCPYIEEQAVLRAHHLPRARQRADLGTHAAKTAGVHNLAAAVRDGRRSPTKGTNWGSCITNSFKGVRSVFLQKDTCGKYNFSQKEPESNFEVLLLYSIIYTLKTLYFSYTTFIYFYLIYLLIHKLLCRFTFHIQEIIKS